MVRNFRISNDLPRCPTRHWRKRTGTPSSIQMAMAIRARNGAAAASASAATPISTNRCMMRSAGLLERERCLLCRGGTIAVTVPIAVAVAGFGFGVPAVEDGSEHADAVVDEPL